MSQKVFTDTHSSAKLPTDSQRYGGINTQCDFLKSIFVKYAITYCVILCFVSAQYSLPTTVYNNEAFFCYNRLSNKVRTIFTIENDLTAQNDECIPINLFSFSHA